MIRAVKALFEMISQSKIFLQGALIALCALVFPVSVFADGVFYISGGSVLNRGQNGSFFIEFDDSLASTTMTGVTLDWGSNSASRSRFIRFYCYGSPVTSVIYVEIPELSASSTVRQKYSVPETIVSGGCSLYTDLSDNLDGTFDSFMGNGATTTVDGGTGFISLHSAVGGSFILEFSPALGSTTASTSVYVSGEGFNAGEYDTFAIEMIGDSPGAVSKSVAWPISSGDFFVEDTVSFPVGQYWGWAVMRDSSRSATEIRKPMKFRVATTSPDTYFGFGLQVFTPTATSAPILPDCIIGSFDLAKCLYALVIPSMTDVVSLLNTATSTLLARMPFGYFTRLTTILLAPVATSTLPSVILTVPDDLPGAGKTLDLTPWPYLFGEDSLLGSTTLPHSSTTLSSLVLPGWNLLVLFIFAAYVFGRVRGILHPSSTV